MKLRFLILALAALCLSAAPATADLFHWTVHNLDLTYNGTDFNASASAASAAGKIDFTRDVPTTGTITLFPGLGTELGNFTIDNMAITNITAATADGAGTFTLTDVIGDTITGSVAGVWTNDTAPIFTGSLSNVFWNNESGDNDFDGWKLVFPTYVPGASVSMGFAAAMPWNGSLIELTADTAGWFGDGAWTDPVLAAGSVDAHVVPVPAAVLLGMLGMSVAGMKLRKRA